MANQPTNQHVFFILTEIFELLCLGDGGDAMLLFPQPQKMSQKQKHMANAHVDTSSDQAWPTSLCLCLAYFDITPLHYSYSILS